MKQFYFFALSSKGDFSWNQDRRDKLWAAIPEVTRTGMKFRMDKDYYLKGDRASVVKRTKNYGINTDFFPLTEYYIHYNRNRLRNAESGKEVK